MRQLFTRPLFGGLSILLMGIGIAHAAQPIAIEDLAREPALQSMSMSPDGKHLVGLIPSPSNKDETELATWDLEALSASPKVVTPSGEHMKFIGAYALKADRILAIARQEWTGQLGGCGEGKLVGATKTFVTKAYLTGADQKKFDEAFERNSHQLGVSRDREICLELAGTAALVDMLPLDPDKVIIRRLSGVSLMTNYYLYDLKSGDTELLFTGSTRTTPALFDSRTGKVLVKSEIEPVGGDYEQRFLILNPKTGLFDVQNPLSTKLSNRYEVNVVGLDDATGKY